MPPNYWENACRSITVFATKSPAFARSSSLRKTLRSTQSFCPKFEPSQDFAQYPWQTRPLASAANIVMPPKSQCAAMQRRMGSSFPDDKSWRLNERIGLKIKQELLPTSRFPSNLLNSLQPILEGLLQAPVFLMQISVYCYSQNKACVLLAKHHHQDC